MLDVQGVPAVNYGGQGGLGDVILHLTLPRIIGFISAMLQKGKVDLAQ